MYVLALKDDQSLYLQKKQIAAAADIPKNCLRIVQPDGTTLYIDMDAGTLITQDQEKLFKSIETTIHTNISRLQTPFPISILSNIDNAPIDKDDYLVLTEAPQIVFTQFSKRIFNLDTGHEITPCKDIGRIEVVDPSGNLILIQCKNRLSLLCNAHGEIVHLYSSSDRRGYYTDITDVCPTQIDGKSVILTKHESGKVRVFVDHVEHSVLKDVRGAICTGFTQISLLANGSTCVISHGQPRMSQIYSCLDLSHPIATLKDKSRTPYTNVSSVRVGAHGSRIVVDFATNQNDAFSTNITRFFDTKLNQIILKNAQGHVYNNVEWCRFFEHDTHFLVRLTDKTWRLFDLDGMEICNFSDTTGTPYSYNDIRQVALDIYLCNSDPFLVGIDSLATGTRYPVLERSQRFFNAQGAHIALKDEQGIVYQSPKHIEVTQSKIIADGRVFNFQGRELVFKNKQAIAYTDIEWVEDIDTDKLVTRHSDGKARIFNNQRLEMCTLTNTEDMDCTSIKRIYALPHYKFIIAKTRGEERAFRFYDLDGIEVPINRLPAGINNNDACIKAICFISDTYSDTPSRLVALHANGKISAWHLPTRQSSLTENGTNTLFNHDYFNIQKLILLLAATEGLLQKNFTISCTGNVSLEKLNQLFKKISPSIRSALCMTPYSTGFLSLTPRYCDLCSTTNPNTRSEACYCCTQKKHYLCTACKTGIEKTPRSEYYGSLLRCPFCREAIEELK